MKKKIFALFLVLVLSLSMFAACGGSSGGGGDAAGGEELPTVEWKLASCWTDGTWLFQVDSDWCALVSRLTDSTLHLTA